MNVLSAAFDPQDVGTPLDELMTADIAVHDEMNRRSDLVGWQQASSVESGLYKGELSY
jgi:hypothetical protein